MHRKESEPAERHMVLKLTVHKSHKKKLSLQYKPTGVLAYCRVTIIILSFLLPHLVFFFPENALHIALAIFHTLGHFSVNSVDDWPVPARPRTRHMNNKKKTTTAATTTTTTTTRFAMYIKFLPILNLRTEPVHTAARSLRCISQLGCIL